MEWHKSFGYVSNPFEYNPLKVDDKLYGYEAELSKLLYWVESGSMGLIQGPQGSGKTRLLRAVIDSFGGKGKVVLLDGDKINHDLDISRILLKNQSATRKALKKYPRNMILLLDNAKALTMESYKRLQFFFDQGYIKSIIFVASDRSDLEFPKSMDDRLGSRVVSTKALDRAKELEMVFFRQGEDPLFSYKNLEDIQKHSGDLKEFLSNINAIGVYMAENDLKRCDVRIIKKVLSK